MAQRRMMSLKVIDTDAFMDMPLSSQALYLHLLIRADDDGFIASPKKIMRMVGASDDDFKILIGKRFILPFESGICVIKHWRIHNLIRSDRYTETQWLEEKEKISIDPKTGKYTEITTPIQNVIPNGNQMEPQVRLGKVRLGKGSKEKVKKESFGEFGKVELSDEEYSKLNDRFGEKNTNMLVFELDTYIASSGKRYKSHYATLLNWAKRKIEKQVEKNTQSSKKMAL